MQNGCLFGQHDVRRNVTKGDFGFSRFCFWPKNRKHHFFAPCVVEIANKRGSTQLEMIDIGKGNFDPNRYMGDGLGLEEKGCKSTAADLQEAVIQQHNG